MGCVQWGLWLLGAIMFIMMIARTAGLMPS
jgi:hypothetical protein